ncbi:hypothetical protein BDF14DRAFT_1995515 [Spinellus fusiger]|nr:hypothetical protein BDF14DRAFT_1995515 [Spinellus fusiger]
MDMEYFTREDVYAELIQRVVKDLFSLSDTKQRRILDYYYFPDADFVSPLLATQSVFNIRHVLLVWRTINPREPTINNICFNGKTCVVYLTQHLSPCLVPWRMEVPVIVTLTFRETETESGLFKIERHEESWCIGGLVASLPLASYWHDRVIRVILGKFITSMGEVVGLASEAVQSMQHNLSIDLSALHFTANPSLDHRLTETPSYECHSMGDEPQYTLFN